MSYVTGHWSFDPLLIVVAVVVLAHEVGLARLRGRSDGRRTRRRRWRSLSFYAGLAVLLVAEEGPIDYWSERYFFVHMIEHILVGFYVPILIVVGAPWIPLLFSLPVALRRRLGRAVFLGGWAGRLRALGRAVRNPWTAVLSFNAAMVLWHFPVLLDLAVHNEVVRIWVMQASFLVTGVLFWLQIIPSRPMRPRASSVWQGGAIVATNVVMFVLAMALSIFSSASWYPVYAHIPGVTLSPFADQQIGAAILWVCGDFWAYPALVVVIRRAITEEGGFSNVLERVVHRLPTTAPTARTIVDERSNRA